MPRAVITGGPGVGKTTLLAELAARGHATVDEAARALIRERLAAGLPARPTPADFAAELLRRDLDKHDQARADAGWTFFDRSAVESLGMLHEQTPLPDDELRHQLDRLDFHPKVFVLPPWREIYRTDAERDHDFAHCLAVHERIAAWYTRCGYAVHELPRAPVAQRADALLARLA